MGNEMQGLKDRIAERVGKDLLELIPKEQWDALVSQQIDHFLTNDAPGVIKNMLTEQLKETVKETLRCPNYQARWGEFGEKITSDGLNLVLRKAAPELVVALFEPMAQRIIDGIRNGTMY